MKAHLLTDRVHNRGENLECSNVLTDRVRNSGENLECSKVLTDRVHNRGENLECSKVPTDQVHNRGENLECLMVFDNPRRSKCSRTRPCRSWFRLQQDSGIYTIKIAFAALKRDGSVIARGHADHGWDCSKICYHLVNDGQSIYVIKSAFAALKVMAG